MKVFQDYRGAGLSSDERDIAQSLGAAAATYLESTLLGHEVVGISSWSSNLLAAATSMQQATGPVVTNVIQLVGGVGDPQVQFQANRLLTTTFAFTRGGGDRGHPDFPSRPRCCWAVSPPSAA
jgi:DNA-binding transcriptional regulator LsrR (DeoR family)